MKTKLTASENEQLTLIDDAMDDGVERSISQDEARVISETARRELERRSIDFKGWIDDYKDLRELGWAWRVAAYIAWASCPVGSRSPRTQAELAELLGLRSDRTIRKWRANNLAIDEAVAVMQVSPLVKYRREIYTALVASATKPEAKHHSDRKLASVLLGDYAETKNINVAGKSKDLSELSDEELAELAKKVTEVGSG